MPLGNCRELMFGVQSTFTLGVVGCMKTLVCGLNGLKSKLVKVAMTLICTQGWCGLEKADKAHYMEVCRYNMCPKPLK